MLGLSYCLASHQVVLDGRHVLQQQELIALSAVRWRTLLAESRMLPVWSASCQLPSRAVQTLIKLMPCLTQKSSDCGKMMLMKGWSVLDASETHMKVHSLFVVLV